MALTNKQVTDLLNGYRTTYEGKYWNAGLDDSKLSANNWGVTTSGCKDNCTSNSFGKATQCYGFALFLAKVIFGDNLNCATLDKATNGTTLGSGWKIYKATYSNISLEPGDIIRTDGTKASEHAAMVSKVEDNGTVYVTELWSSQGCIIKWNQYYNGNEANKYESNIKNIASYILKAPKNGTDSMVTVTFNAMGGTCGTANKSYRVGSAFGTLPTPNRSQYKFDGWFTASSGGTKITASSVVPNTNTTLYAHWSKTKTTVTFVQYSGGPSSTVDYTPGQAYGTLPSSMNRNNFRFLGWFTSASGGTKITASSIVPSSNTTLYGQWKYFSYVTFDENFEGGKTTVKECISGEKYGNVFPDVTSRRNFRFLGWFTGRTSGNQITSDSLAASYPSYTLYAHWKYFSYVTFDENFEGGKTYVKECISGEPYGHIFPMVSSREGYRFDGWFTGREDGDMITSSTNAASYPSYSLYAHWTKLTKVTLIYNNDSVDPPIIPYLYLTPGEKHGNALPVPNSTLLRFEGWYFTSFIDSSTKVTPDTKVAPGYETLTACWSAPVTFHTTSTGGTFQELWFEVGRKFGKVLPTPVRNSYVFEGWYFTNFVCDSARITADDIVRPMSYNLIAGWSVPTTFDYNYPGGASEVINIIEGERIGTYLPSPTRSGYRLKGWCYVPSDLGVYISPDTKVTSPYTIYAQWDDTVQVTLDNGSIKQENPVILCKIGKSYGELPIPELDNYRFDGWYYRNSEGEVKITSDSIVPAENHTLFARWSIPNTFNYNYPGGASEVVYIINGDKIGAYLPTPVRDGYRLKGWYYTPNDLNVYLSPDEIITSSYTFYAHWDKQ